MRYFLILISILVVSIGHAQLDKPERKRIDFKNKYFEGMRFIDTMAKMRTGFQYVTLSKKDSTYFFEHDFSNNSQPFYISDHEVTNAEYREFVDWVKDSLTREKLFKRSNLENKSKWVLYVDYDTHKKDENGKFYLLNWETKLDYSDPMIIPLIDDIYYSTKERYYKRRVIDTRLLLFDYHDDEGNHERINIYPDTICWNYEFQYSNILTMAQLYFWHPGYANYPVVGVTYKQAEAYCHWRTMMYHRAAGRNPKGSYDKSLKFRLPSIDEWERAGYGYRNKSDEFLRDIQNGYETNKDGYYQANYGMTYLNSGITQKNFNDDGILYTGKVLSYAPNFNNLYCMYGNVAEWTKSNPKIGSFFTDYISPFRLDYGQPSKNTKSLYITDPYSDSTFLLERGSAKHKELIQKRIEFYKVNPEDSFEDVIKKLFAINSISDAYVDKIQELNFPKDSLKIDTIKNAKNENVTQGIVYKKNEEVPNRNADLKLYNIETGSYFYTGSREENNFFIQSRLRQAFEMFQQNANALTRAKKSFPTNYLMEEDPKGYLSLVKGGNWFDEAHYLLLYNSQVFHKKQSSCRIGFRIAANSVGGELNKEDKERIREQRELFKKAGWIKSNGDKR
jgi:formylglycine-generating enzyme required for sulfatase activity